MSFLRAISYLTAVVLCIFFTSGYSNTAVGDPLNGLGLLPGNDTLIGSGVTAIASSGNFFVGAVTNPGFDLPLGGLLGLASPSEAVRWTASGEILSLGYLPNAAIDFSIARAINDDGTVVVGTARDADNRYQAFRWIPSGGMVGIGFLSNAFAAGSMGNSVSGDGQVIVGSSWDGDFNYRAFRWSSAVGMEALGTLANSASDYSEAFGTNPDGSIVVGLAENDFNRLEAFKWTQSDGMVGLGFLAASDQEASQATAISSDGSTIVGVAINSDGKPEAFRWTIGSGMIGLGILPTSGQFGSRATAVNSDGSVIVGGASIGIATKQHQPDIRASVDNSLLTIASLNSSCLLNLLLGSGGGFTPLPGSCSAIDDLNAFSPQQAFRWTNADGLHSVAELLIESGVDIGEWQISQANGVSADGSIIVGEGIDPDGNSKGWWAKIGTGFISTSELNHSLESLTGVGQSTQQSISNGLGETLGENMTGGASQSQGTTTAWGGIGGAEFNVLKIDPYSLSGTVGLAYQVTSAVKLGAGIHYGTRKDHLPVLDGSNQSERMGIDLIGAYEPSTTGLRLYGALVADHLNDRIRRGYLNGATPTSSTGKRSGQAIGGTIVLGWNLPTGAATSVMPFIGYEASYFKLEEYTETTGPFPVHVNQSSDTLQIARLGAKLNQKMNEQLELWTSFGAAHRVEKRMPGASGEVIALSLPFNVSGATMRQNWAEGSLGIIWHATKSVDVHAGIGASTDGDTAPLAFTRLGLSISL